MPIDFSIRTFGSFHMNIVEAGLSVETCYVKQAVCRPQSCSEGVYYYGLVLIDTFSYLLYISVRAKDGQSPYSTQQQILNYYHYRSTEHTLSIRIESCIECCEKSILWRYRWRANNSSINFLNAHFEAAVLYNMQLSSFPQASGCETSLLGHP